MHNIAFIFDLLSKEKITLKGRTSWVFGFLNSSWRLGTDLWIVSVSFFKDFNYDIRLVHLSVVSHFFPNSFEDLCECPLALILALEQTGEHVTHEHECFEPFTFPSFTKHINQNKILTYLKKIFRRNRDLIISKDCISFHQRHFFMRCGEYKNTAVRHSWLERVHHRKYHIPYYDLWIDRQRMLTNSRSSFLILWKTIWLMFCLCREGEIGTSEPLLLRETSRLDFSAMEQ